MVPSKYGSTEQKEGLLNAIERFLSVWLYPWAFTPSNTDDEEIDLKLQDRIRSFHWISHKHLDAPIDPYSPQQSRHLEDAILRKFGTHLLVAYILFLKCLKYFSAVFHFLNSYYHFL